MSRAFRHLFEKLKETNANEWSQGCRSRPGHHPGLGTATAPGDKRSVAALNWRRPLINLRAAAGACHLSLARGEFSETCGKTTKETKKIMPDPYIRTAMAADAERCLGALTLAFSGDPPCRWAWPDPQQYLEAFPRFARAFGGWAIEHGTAHYYEVFPVSPCGCRPVLHRTRNL